MKTHVIHRLKRNRSEKRPGRRLSLFFAVFLTVLIGLTALFISKPSLLMNLRHRLFSPEAGPKLLPSAHRLPSISDPGEGWRVLTASELLSGNPDFEAYPSLLLLNGENGWPGEIPLQLAEAGSPPMQMNILMAESYQALREAVGRECGETLYVRSAYLKDSDLPAADQSPLTAPGCLAEHAGGLSLDFYFFEHEFEAYLQSPAARWLAEHAFEYGFILRYPEGKEDITHVRAIPWHYRYTGLPHAEIIYRQGLTLEEYLHSLKDGFYYNYKDCWLSRQSGGTYILPANIRELRYSADNEGGIVFWGKSIEEKAEDE